YRQERHQQFSCVVFRQPRHVFIDDPLDGVSRIAQIAAQAVAFVKSEIALRTHHVPEVAVELRDLFPQSNDAVAVLLVDADFDDTETLQRKLLRIAECLNQIVTGRGGEILDRYPHSRDRALEIATGAGERGGMIDRLKSPADIAFARYVRETVGKEAEDRDQSQDNDADADRNRCNKAFRGQRGIAEAHGSGRPSQGAK